MVRRRSREKSADLGTLEPGKLADIVMLDGNPLDGYWNLLNTRVVIKGGVGTIPGRSRVCASGSTTDSIMPRYRALRREKPSEPIA